MPYELHLEREASPQGPLTRAEWESAVSSTAGVRLIEGGSTVPLPDGRRVPVPAKPGDAEVWLDDAWTATFWWHDGRVTFNAVPGIEDPDHPTHRIAAELARKLGATLSGDDGEVHEWT